MTIFGGVKKHPEQIHAQRLSLFVNLPFLLHLLLGRTPVRRLAQSLIAVLLLISPLSFSTDKVPNFVYECPVASGSSVKPHRVVAEQRSVLFTSNTIVSHQQDLCTFPPPFTPTVELISSSFPCRAPPA